MYSIFLVSSFTEHDTEDQQSLFKHYRDSETVLMNVNSPLFKDIIVLQGSVDAVQKNTFMAKKLIELRPRFFQAKNFRTAFIKEYKDFTQCKCFPTLSLLLMYSIQLEEGLND